MKTKIGPRCMWSSMPAGWRGKLMAVIQLAFPACLQITWILCSQDELRDRSSSVWTETPDTRHSDSKLSKKDSALSSCVSGINNRSSDSEGVPQSKGCQNQRLSAQRGENIVSYQQPPTQRPGAESPEAQEPQIHGTGRKQR